MCHFITIAVPARKSDCVAEAFGSAFETPATANPTVLAALPEGYAARLLISGMCSCGMYTEPGSDGGDRIERQMRRKYARRGWSKTKIDRTIEQWKSQRERYPVKPGFRSDVVTHLQALCRSAGRVALLVHWYDGDIETEPLALTRTSPCSCDDLPQRAASVREDEILAVSAAHS